jgi:predicted kinase
MIRTLIALRGVANSGKSTTVKRVFGSLKSRHKDAVMNHGKFGRDFRVVLTIKRVVKIGIESMGDPNSRLAASLELFVKEGCKVIICATRTRGQTVDAVNNLAKRYEVTWFEQVRSASSKHQASNAAMARRIFRAAEKAIRL